MRVDLKVVHSVVSLLLSPNGRALCTWALWFETVSCPQSENRSGLRTDGSKGRGSGVVIATGAETEFGVIFSMMQDVSTMLL